MWRAQGSKQCVRKFPPFYHLLEKKGNFHHYTYHINDWRRTVGRRPPLPWDSIKLKRQTITNHPNNRQTDRQGHREERRLLNELTVILVGHTYANSDGRTDDAQKWVVEAAPSPKSDEIKNKTLFPNLSFNISKYLIFALHPEGMEFKRSKRQTLGFSPRDVPRAWTH